MVLIISMMIRLKGLGIKKGPPAIRKDEIDIVSLWGKERS